MIRSAAVGRALLLAALVGVTALAGCVGDEDESQAADPIIAPWPASDDIEVEIVAVHCPAGYDNRNDDHVCLAYNGQIPGPTWVFEAGQQVNITVRHRVAESLEELGIDGFQHLASARYSLHRHGISVAACGDGIAKPAGTSLCDSTVGPGGTIKYRFDALFPGAWHYHDHGHTFSASAENGPLLGGEAIERGLWGSFIVLPPGESTDHVFDLHLTDAGANAGMRLDATAARGDRFDLNVIGLGYAHRFYDVRLEDPGGDLVDEVVIGPGVSRAITVLDAQPGTYTWTAEGRTVLVPTGHVATIPWNPGSFTGTISVAEGQADQDRPTSPASLAQADRPSIRPEPDHRFVIPFNYEAATRLVRSGETMGLPLFEAKVGDVIEFRVVSSDSIPHVFHLHGHPWKDAETGRFIDAVPLVPGDKTTHTFTVVAGLDAGYAGDWLYHCHVGFDQAMWGVLRVHA